MNASERAALEQALAAVRQAEAAILAALSGDAEDEPCVGSKEAARIWNVTEDAARKRLKRIGSLDLDGRWRAPISRVRAGASSGSGKVIF